ncbi:MAG: CD1871A family CXXC motif-containing protein [Blautia sp.]|nr:CD1871A family CXXC motif-containing protein [Blautia sp.]
MHFWKNSRCYGWLLGVIAGILFLVIGGSQGQFEIIWKKAIMICLECIGIG